MFDEDGFFDKDLDWEKYYRLIDLGLIETANIKFGVVDEWLKEYLS